MEQSERPALMQLQVGNLKRILLTAGIMFALILFVFYFNLPNPNMILIAGLVLCSALFGFSGGIVAGIIMLGYTMYFFSTDHSFVHFTSENLQKVGVTLVGVTADVLLVCILKQSEIRAFSKIDDLTKSLQIENEKLEQMSLTDALTGIRNRMALRLDYDSYLGHAATVMMMDLDDFKLINDTRGHEEGDRILREIGMLLSRTFGKEHCYRYGGDEFLVIIPDMPVSEFEDKLDEMLQSRPVIDGNSRAVFSIGYVHAQLDRPDDLRTLISNADEKMYEVKRDRHHAPAIEKDSTGSRTEISEYTADGMRQYLNEMSGKYDLARVVDPIECRIIDIQEDGRINMNERCYGIWNAEQKCLNCSSAAACRSGCHQEKEEHFKDDVYFIQSDPVKLKLPDGSSYNAVVELVKVGKESSRAANDREAENIGNRAAHYLARHDSLTNALNAEAFYDLCREKIQNEDGISWVMITSNIMNFRLVNTLFSVQKGNEILIRTASMLRRISERANGLCGRLGGDQFGLLIPAEFYKGKDLQDAACTLAEGFHSGIFTFCIHFGVYQLDDSTIPVSVMCGRANSALRTIRDDMSQTIAYFNDDILQKILFEQKVLGSFEKALKDGEFRMYLQPLVEGSGKVIGAEALARWYRSDGIVVMPGDFIEILEDAGQIQKLDVYIWELAVKQLSIWKETERSGLSISVNMSAKDLFSIDVYDVLTKLIEKYGVDSSALRLEITETALLVDPEKSDAVISRLRQRGFIIEIDDFGKGYSSLGLLKNITADVIKIDMSFLQEIRDNERNALILRSVIGLSDSLGMDVITEGVETQQQLQVLTEMGCNLFQGYYFSRPLPVDIFEKEIAV